VPSIFKATTGEHEEALKTLMSISYRAFARVPTIMVEAAPVIPLRRVLPLILTAMVPTAVVMENVHV